MALPDLRKFHGRQYEDSRHDPRQDPRHTALLAMQRRNKRGAEQTRPPPALPRTDLQQCSRPGRTMQFRNGLRAAKQAFAHLPQKTSKTSERKP
ncbi:MAG: hypothetical protein ACI8UD_003421 [Planctomycetota bacterium]|jgi:hypothetical protein